ncbi:hypothetical protein GCM10007877_36410 [Marinibactrum halimedae]|uniref:Uncharacterized protein n=1 Tax=Marinibactrum halimedae TaxID=1444977 RepID=A0AA37WR23_9GAMM|nr:hypothetical protein GCM10007877_36410 [Marinibactrum halimedae]
MEPESSIRNIRFGGTADATTSGSDDKVNSAALLKVPNVMNTEKEKTEEIFNHFFVNIILPSACRQR